MDDGWGKGRAGLTEWTDGCTRGNDDWGTGTPLEKAGAEFAKGREEEGGRGGRRAFAGIARPCEDALKLSMLVRRGAPSAGFRPVHPASSAHAAQCAMPIKGIYSNDRCKLSSSADKDL